jgi:hypothetical protein
VFSTVSRPVQGFTPFSCTVDIFAASQGAEWQGHEVDHSLPSSAEVKNAYSHTSSWRGA